MFRPIEGVALVGAWGNVADMSDPDEPAIEPLDDCSKGDAQSSIKKHRDVAICGSCGRLILCWDNSEEQPKTRAELRRHGVAFGEGRQGALFLTAKERSS